MSNRSPHITNRRARSGRSWGIAVAALAALAAFVPAHPARAQTVMVQVLGAETSQPLVGAIAHLVSPSGEVVASRLADGNGRALFPGVAAGRYSVRAEMIGHSDGTSDVFGVVAGGSVPLVLRLETRAIPLAGVEVTAEAGPCEMRPSEEGRLLADVWQEARKALTAAAVTDQQGIYRYSLVTYEQELDADGVILGEDRARREGYMRTPFASRAIEELTDEGFVHRTTAEWTYYAPDAQALLSDPFLDTHCFRLVGGGAERPDLVGLAFEPTGENEDVADISGTLWMGRDSVDLRWLDFTYENLEPDVRPGDATGRIEFMRMAEGTWIVPTWWIRTPVVEVDVGRLDRSRTVVGFHRTGGQVEQIVEAGGRDLARGSTTGALEGIVVDSLGVPIQGVRVGSVASSQTLFTNAEGRFNLVGLAAGTHRIAFAHAALDELGFPPPVTTQEVAAGVSSYVEFHMPSPADLLPELCGGETVAGTSVLGGVVRSAEGGGPMAGAQVRVRWSEIELNGAAAGVVGRERFTELHTTADARGVYRFCSVPRREELTLVSHVDGMDGPAATLAISGGEAARMHVLRHAPVRRGPSVVRDAVPPREPTADADEPSARAGLVRDAATGAPLAGVLVELPELGVQVVSDAAGLVSLEDLPPGEHTLRAELVRYHVSEGRVAAPGVGALVVELERSVSDDPDAPGAIVGRVTNESGQAVGDVDVQVVGHPTARALADRQGRFRIDGLEPGLLEVQFERLGHTPRTARFVVQPGRTAELAVEMPTRAIELEPISVTVRSESLDRSGFYERRDRGFGTQFDRADIERLNPESMYGLVQRERSLDVNDPLRSQLGAPVYAVNPRVISLSARTDGPPRAVDSRRCYLSLYIDGLLMRDPDLQQISPAVVDAVEIYMGSGTPVEYRRNPCGAILIWTRR